MKRTRIIGLCLLAAFAMSALAATSASAVAPEFGKCEKKAVAEGTGYSDNKCTKAGTGKKAVYAWTAGASGVSFTSKGGAATLLTVSGKTVTCTSEKSTGVYLTGDNKHEETTVDFAGCKSAGFKCTTAGKGEGELTTNPLVGEVNWEVKSTKKTALKLEPAAGNEGFFIKFKCVNLNVEVRGGPVAAKAEHPGILVNIKNGLMTAKEVLKYTNSKGVQKPTKWEGEPKETYLESSFEKLAFEQSGQTITSTVENVGGVLLELNPVV